MNVQRTKIRSLVALAAACGALAGVAAPALAKPKDACGILTLADLQRSFPGSTITPPERRGLGGCAWSADAPNGNDDMISITIRYDDTIRWPMDVKTHELPDPAAYRRLAGIGTESFYSSGDGVFFRKAGFIVEVSLLDPAGVPATAPREIALARFVAAKFDGLSV